jgi:predicted dehydrogenase
MRFGVCGTAHWAEQVHLTGLAANPSTELVGVYGRNAERVAALAARFRIPGFTDLDAFLAETDAVSFSVPPNVQPSLAAQAARQHKHLLLEKPVARTVEDAKRLKEQVRAENLAAVCFLTRLFVPEMQQMIRKAREIRPTEGRCVLRSGAVLAGSPYAGSAWRQEENGALWDAAPHGLSVACAILGRAREIEARRADDGAIDVHVGHESGAASTISVNLRDPDTQRTEAYAFRAGAAEVGLDRPNYDRPAAFNAAASLLMKNAATDAGVAPDGNLALAVDLIALLEAAEESLAVGGRAIDCSDRLSARYPILPDL